MPVSHLNYKCFLDRSIGFNPENEVIEMKNLLTRATAHVSFWGTRSVEVTGFKGSLDIKEVALALKTIIFSISDPAPYLSEQGSDELMSCVLKMRELYLATDTIINNANWFQWLCHIVSHAVKNFFSSIDESSENSPSKLRSYVECLPTEIDLSNPLKSCSFEKKAVEAKEKAILQHEAQRVADAKARELHRFGTFCEQPNQNHQVIREAFYQLPPDSQELIKGRMWRIANQSSVATVESKEPFRQRYLENRHHPAWNFPLTNPDWAGQMLHANPLPLDLLIAATPLHTVTL